MERNNLIIRLDYLLGKVVPGLMIFFLLSIVIITILDIGSRFIFNTSMTGARALTKYLFIWLIFMGISYGIKSDEHFKMTELLDRFPDKLQQFMKIFTVSLLAVFFAILLFVSGFQLMPIIWDKMEIATGIRARYFYLSMPVGSFFAVLVLLRKFLDFFNE